MKQLSRTNRPVDFRSDICNSNYDQHISKKRLYNICGNELKPKKKNQILCMLQSRQAAEVTSYIRQIVLSSDRQYLPNDMNS